MVRWDDRVGQAGKKSRTAETCVKGGQGGMPGRYFFFELDLLSMSVIGFQILLHIGYATTFTILVTI